MLSIQISNPYVSIGVPVRPMFTFRPFRPSVKTETRKIEDLEIDLSNSSQVMWKESLIRWTKVAVGAPDDVEAKIQMIEAYEHLNQPEKVEQITEELLKQNADHILVKTLVARQLTNDGDVVEARAAWQRLIDQDPQYIEPYIRLINLEFEDNNLDAADRFIADFEAIQPENNKILLYKGRVAQKRKAWQVAYDIWQKLLEKQCPHYEAELQQGHCLYELGRYDEAMENIELSMERHPDSNQFKFSKLRLLVKTQRQDEALDLVFKMANQYPDDMAVKLEKAKLLFSAQRIEESEELCTEVLEAHPNDVRFLTLYARIGQKLVREASIA